jgi:multidrug efflux pump subunit AcrB
MQAAQEITIGARLNKTQFQYTLNDTDPGELNHWATLFLDKLKTVLSIADVATHQFNTAPMLDITIKRDGTSGYGILPYMIDNTLDDAFGQRFGHLYNAATIPRHSTGPSQVPVWVRGTPRHLRQIRERPAGANIDASRLSDQGRPARRQPSGPVPLGHDLIQSRAGCRDR